MAYEITDTSPPILTSKVGMNADQFPDILNMYLPEDGIVLDMTYGSGAFWKYVEGVEVVKNDIDPDRGDYSYDFRSLPESWEDRFDMVVLDPPYLLVGGIKTLKKSIDRGYRNKKRKRHGIPAVHQLYAAGFIEAWRVMKRKGTLVFKCMDQVQSGKQSWEHIELMRLAEILGFRHEDLFVMVNKNTPTMRHSRQLHARRNHSYFCVERKP